MKIQIKKLTPTMIEDFLYYFDKVGFTDHPEWEGCYCLESHLSEKEQGTLKPLGVGGRREKAKELVLSGVMNGYLIYDEEKPVGWCNSDNKKNYCGICAGKEFNSEEEKELKVKIAYCFDIAPEYRGKGIASRLLERICKDAKAEGYDVVEGYPRKDLKGEELEFQYHGPVGLYEKMGFEKIRESEVVMVMRKRV